MLEDEANPPADPDAHYRRAAVLLLIYPRAGDDYVVFMRRTETVEHHKGQISLPGGAQDPVDPEIVSTALREAQEEIGVDPDAVEVLGTLRDVYARISWFVITPVIGRLKREHDSEQLIFRPNPNEVAELIEVPLSFLRDERNHRTSRRTLDGTTYLVHHYDYGPYEIWGVTGRILHEFLTRGQHLLS